MKTVSVRDLRYGFPKVEEMLRSGEEICVTKRRRVIARMTAEPPVERVGRPPIPDFLGRMKGIFGDEVLTITGAQIISEDRGDRF
jgi:antitoxin (DNA-binding transcriptional repressor) of toxin-antitoxin stability system